MCRHTSSGWDSLLKDHPVLLKFMVLGHILSFTLPCSVELTTCQFLSTTIPSQVVCFQLMFYMKSVKVDGLLYVKLSVILDLNYLTSQNNNFLKAIYFPLCQ